MVESEFMINRKEIFKDHKYLIIISKEKEVAEKFDAETKFSVIKYNINKQTSLQKNVVNEMKKRLEKKIDERFFFERAVNLESSTLKQICSLSERINETEVIYSNVKSVFDAINNLK